MTLSFLFPLGLIGLIGIPILIAVYIIKNKYTEQTVASTYIWNVSNRFLKKKKKLPKIAGILSLVLQLLSVALISLIIAHPVLTYPDAANEYCFVLDGSGSMKATKDGKTRFELAKEEIADVIDGSVNGSVYTLILATDTSEDKVFELLDDKEEAISLLASVEPSYSAIDVDRARQTAEGYFAENSLAKVYLVTDTDYERHENVEIINVSRNEKNAAISEVSHILSGGELTVSATVKSYGIEGDVGVRFYLDGSEEAIIKTASLSEEGDEATVTFTAKTAGYNSFRISLDLTDALSEDNEVVCYNVNSESTYSTLIVSDTPFFIESALETVTGIDARAVTIEEYERGEDKNGEAIQKTGYGLYVFDAYAPESLPKDGSVWFFGLEENVDGIGFSIQGLVEPKEHVNLTLSEPNSTTIERLTDELVGEKLYVKKYIKYGVNRYDEIFTYNKQPVVFANENSYENRQVVFAFSLHDSNMAMLPDFGILVRNMVLYSFPDILERTGYTTGEKLEINIPASCTEIKITTPSGRVEYPVSDAAANEFVLNEPGTYTIELGRIDTLPLTVNASARLCSSESDLNGVGTDFSLTDEGTSEGRDGIYDDLIIYIIILAVILSLDWMVYCYDKYQLR